MFYKVIVLELNCLLHWLVLHTDLFKSFIPIFNGCKMKFTIECEMGDRWVPHFRGMLEYMQSLGALGSSRKVTMFADGDGDFRPTFVWPADLPEPAKPKREDSGNRFYDAG